MAEYIEFKGNVILGANEVYATITHIQDTINDEEKSLQYYKEKLLMLAVANPRDLLKEDESVIWEIHTTFNDIWIEILELNTKIYKLYLYLKYAKEHGIINPFEESNPFEDEK